MAKASKHFKAFKRNKYRHLKGYRKLGIWRISNLLTYRLPYPICWDAIASKNRESQTNAICCLNMENTKLTRMVIGVEWKLLRMDQVIVIETPGTNHLPQKSRIFYPTKKKNRKGTAIWDIFWILTPMMNHEWFYIEV